MTPAIRNKVGEVVAGLTPPDWSREPFRWIHGERGRVGRLEELNRGARYFDLVDVEEAHDRRFTCKANGAQTWRSRAKVRVKYIPDGDPTDHEQLLARVREDGRTILKGVLGSLAFAGLVKSMRAGPDIPISTVEERDGVRALYLEVPLTCSYVA